MCEFFSCVCLFVVRCRFCSYWWTHRVWWRWTGTATGTQHRCDKKQVRMEWINKYTIMVSVDIILSLHFWFWFWFWFWSACCVSAAAICCNTMSSSHRSLWPDSIYLNTMMLTLNLTHCVAHWCNMFSLLCLPVLADSTISIDRPHDEVSLQQTGGSGVQSQSQSQSEQ